MNNISDKKYKIIYADPPWSYYNDSDSYFSKTTKVGVRKPPYNVLGSDSIKKLPVGEIADDDCFLFIWTTDYHLDKCIEVIKEWGFKYKTIGFAWQKLNKKGEPVCFTGAYTLKSGIELCLLATKGGVGSKSVINKKVRALINSPREFHSKKPDVVRNRIVELLGDIPRIELFARKRTKGWDVWGNEVPEENKWWD